MSGGDKSSQAGNREQVRPGEILQDLDKQVSGKEKAEGRVLSPLQWVGLWLALAFFVYIIIASGTIFYVSFGCIQLPPFPTPPSNSGDPEQYKRLVDAYKQSADRLSADGKGSS